jgi:hypothetical protein
LTTLTLLTAKANEVNLVNTVRKSIPSIPSMWSMPSKTNASAAGGRIVGDFSEITAWNQSKRNLISGCCEAAWRRSHF